MDNDRNKNSIIQISNIIGHFLSLSKKGNNYITICPFHNDNHPSLVINDKKGIFKCFACGESGNAIIFISKYLNISLSKAVIECAKILNLDYKKIGFDKYLNNNSYENEKLFEINQKIYETYEYFLNQNKKAIEYLSFRGINKNDIKKFAIGYAPSTKEFLDVFIKNNPTINLLYLEELGILKKDNNDYFCFFENRIIFSIKNQDNQILGFSARRIDDNSQEPKYINSVESKIFKKQNILYNMENVNNSTSLYVFEGFMDVIASSKLEVNNAVATMGVAFSEQHLKLIREQFEKLKIIILSFDNDLAGKKAIDNAAKIIKNKYYIYVLNYDKYQYKDIDEALKNNPNEAADIIKTLVDYPSYKINELLLNVSEINELDKLVVLQNCIDVLNNYYNELSFDKNVNLIAEKLNLTEKVILSKININFRNNNYKNSSKQSQKTLNITFNNEIENNIVLVEKINKLKKIESYLLMFFIYDRKFFDFFLKQDLAFLKNKICNDLFNKIGSFYANNININFLLEIDLKELINKMKITSDELSFFVDLYNNTSKEEFDNLKYDLTIKKYFSILINEQKQNLLDKDNSNDQEKITRILDLNKKYKI